MLWIKAFHIIFVSSWFAGLFYLPRIFVNLASVPADSHAERERLLVMARKLYRFSGLLMVVALALGLGLWLAYGIGRHGPGNGWLYAKGALVVVAILYPFVGWRLPGVGPFDFLLLGWPRHWTWFDVISNLLGYLPFGFLLFVALTRSGLRSSVAAALACAGGTLLSLGMEVLQNFLPHRVSSN